MKKKYILYAVLFFAICLFPVAGLAVPEREEVSENRTRAKAPVLKDENGWNPDFLSDAGEWFQDHFGFRQELVTVNALIQGKIFGVSAAGSVIQGTDG